MSREIRFRAWDLRTNNWWTNVLSEMGESNMYDDSLSMWEVGKMLETGDESVFKWCQYTGVEDIYDFPIFEGHILSSDEGNGVVIFFNGCWTLDCGNDSYNLYEDIAELEVIGHRFQR